MKIFSSPLFSIALFLFLSLPLSLSLSLSLFLSLYLSLYLYKKVLQTKISLNNWKHVWITSPVFAANMNRLLLINPFHATSLFLYPLKASENIWSFEVFRVYRNRAMAWCRLEPIKISIIIVILITKSIS